jgi:hypothetical protein
MTSTDYKMCWSDDILDRETSKTTCFSEHISSMDDKPHS